MQEVITLTVFAIFSTTYLKERPPFSISPVLRC